MTARSVVRIGVIALLVLAALASSALVAAGADPAASPAPGGDVRTDPTAPGLAGAPLLAVAGVLVIGLLAAAATLLAVRLSERR